MKSIARLLIIIVLAALVASACGAEKPADKGGYVLTTALQGGKLVFVGVGSDIEGVVNPELKVQPGESVTVTLINGEGAEHDIFFPDVDAKTARVSGQGNSAAVTFTAPSRAGAFKYLDSVPGHAEAGMLGWLVVGDAEIPAESPVSSSGSDMGMDHEAGAIVEPTGVTVEYHLESALQDGKMIYLGVGGEVDGQVNPDLKANPGDTVKLTLTSGEGAQHNFVIDEFNAKSEDVIGAGSSVTLEFMPDRDGTFAYYCSIPGHRQAGMEGKFIVGTGEAAPSASAEYTSTGGSAAAPAPVAAGPADPNAVDITRDPTDLPPSVGARGPENVRLDLETVELTGKLADGTTYTYWTFNGLVPGPMIRVRVGDTVEVHLKNNMSTTMTHSMDFHAVTGPGGGAVATQTQPGQETILHIQGTQRGPVRLSLRHPHGRRPHRQRHVRSDPGRAGRRPARRGPRVLCDAGRVVHRPALRFDRPAEQRYHQTAGREPRVLRLQRRRHGPDHGRPFAQGQCRRDRAHLLRRGRAQLRLLLPRHRRDLRPGL